MEGTNSTRQLPRQVDGAKGEFEGDRRWSRDMSEAAGRSAGVLNERPHVPGVQPASETVASAKQELIRGVRGMIGTTLRV